MNLVEFLELIITFIKIHARKEHVKNDCSVNLHHLEWGTLCRKNNSQFLKKSMTQEGERLGELPQMERNAGPVSGILIQTHQQQKGHLFAESPGKMNMTGIIGYQGITIHLAWCSICIVVTFCKALIVRDLP